MADYHPLIARAVAGLEKNTGENRRLLYERARHALVGQLRGVQPALDESEITRERLALEEAIRKVEAEAARQARETIKPSLSRRPEQPRPEPPRPVVRTPVAPSPPPLQRGGPVAIPPILPTDEPPVQPPAPQPPPQREFVPQRPQPPNRRSLQDEGLQRFRETPARRESGEQGLPPTPPASPPPPARSMLPPEPADERPSRNEQPQPATPERHPLEEYGQLEPQIESDNLWALPLDAHAEPPVDLDTQRAPVEHETQPHHDVEEQMPARRPPRSYAGIIRLGLALVLLSIIGALAAWQRHTIVEVASGVISIFRSAPATAPPKEAAAPARPKIADRIGQPAPAPSAGPPVAQRVVLYEEEPDDPQGKRFVGTVLWKTEMRPASPGRPPELAVRADVEVPERKMSITFSFRRNTDASLPASHTVEIVFTLPADTPSGGVQKVPGVLMKQAEQTRGVPLAGLAVPVTPGYFLIGLSSVESDMQRNIQLLKERGWFDIPIIYNNNRRAILAMEKGTPGEQAFNAAFAAWKQ